ncbi:MAG: 50S ribosomal protein L16 [archaeon]|nr:50S ribosomal protein L16 [archaeon]
MGLRPGRCYSSTKDRAYTRHAVRVQKRDYIGAVPGLKTRQWNMGNGIKEFDTLVNLKIKCPKQGIQIRDNALESARIIINRHLVTSIGKEDFFLKLRVYPHQILRENKQAQGAGADRVSKGMSHSYGKSVGRAARMRNGQNIFSVLIDSKDTAKAKKALLTATSRFPCEVTVEVSNDISSIGTKPKKTRDMRKAESTGAEEVKEGEEKKEDAKGAKKTDSKDAKKTDAKAPATTKGSPAGKKDDKAKAKK